ncbi:MAG: efflux RND transporter permease subunit, partial [Bdellovibrionota bacterium]
MLVSLGFFAASLAVVGKINKEFVPAQDQGNFMIRLQMPVESSIHYTDQKFREAEKAISEHPALARYFVAVGGFGGGEVNAGIIFITMKAFGSRGVDPKTKRETTQQNLMDAFRVTLGKIPDVKVFIQDLSMRGFSASRGFPVEFTIRGPNWDELALQSETITKGMTDSGLLTDVDTDYRLGKPEIRVVPDREKAALRGVSIRTISETVGALVGGSVVGKYSAFGRRYDILVRLAPDERDEGEKINRLYIRNNRGELVRLSEVVTIENRKALQQISRNDRERAISIFANVAPGKSQALAIEAAQTIARKSLPPGYRAVMSGSAQTFKESFQDLLFALVLGLVVAYMVLASQFNSFVDPITVLLALPFSLSGAFLALYLTNNSINIYSFIGIILLMGIVKKNSILLVEFTHQVRARNQTSVREALLEACPIRLRPILMTSIATIAGAIPAALALGPGAETRIPMAIAVIGG